MNLSKTALAGILGFIGLLAYISALRAPGADAQTVIGLAGVVLGSTISAAVQIYAGRNDQTDKYRLAAIERRLQAHQDAFALWKELTANLNSKAETLGPIILKCQDWYNRNCLFLEKEAGEKFRIAYMSAGLHRQLVEARADGDTLKDNFKGIWSVGDALRAAVALPAIGEGNGDVKVIGAKKES